MSGYYGSGGPRYPPHPQDRPDFYGMRNGPQAPGAYPWHNSHMSGPGPFPHQMGPQRCPLSNPGRAPLLGNSGTSRYGQSMGDPEMGGPGGYGTKPSSISDLVDVAKKRASKQQEAVGQGVDILRGILTADQIDDPIVALHEGLAKSNVSCLHLSFESDFLCNVDNAPLFTGIVTLTDYFLVRGMGATKESCKRDTYRRAFDLIVNSTTDEVLLQEDIGEQALCQEVYRMYQQNPYAFFEMLETSKEADQAGYWGPPGSMPGPAGPGMQGPAGPGMQQPPSGGEAQSENQTYMPNALIPPKVSYIMSPADSLDSKLIKLKELLKEEGITKMHIVPKIDQHAMRVAINIMNVIKYSIDPNYSNAENHRRIVMGKCPVYVEVYFDESLIGLGKSDKNPATAVDDAYQNLANTMTGAKDMADLVRKARRWDKTYEMSPDIFDILIKKPGKDIGCIYANNLPNMTQMMQHRPDFSRDLEHLIITEHETDSGDTSFKVLELSCTRNHVLLEWEISRNPDNSFSCCMSANGKYAGHATHTTKAGCKRLCSDKIMKQLNKNNDHIMVSKDYSGVIINKTFLVTEANTLYLSGIPPAKIPHKKGHIREMKNQAKAGDKFGEEKKKIGEKLDELPENIALLPLLPYMAAAMYKIIDDHLTKMTLEDIVIDTEGMPKSQYELVNQCALQMGFRVITRVRSQAGKSSSLLRRTVNAREMMLICQVNGGSSGRYSLKRQVHPIPEEEITKYKADHVANHQALILARQQDPTNESTPNNGSGATPMNLF